MIGYIDVGGGMRDIYGAGVLDRCMELGLGFDFHVGVSAGSANLCSYLAGQKGRSYRFYTVYSRRPEYLGGKALLHTGSYLNLEYIYGRGLSNRSGEDPLDYPALARCGRTFRIVATNAKTGRPVYFDLSDMSQDDYGAVKASSCVPVAAKAYYWKHSWYFDGGLSDPIPWAYALSQGCDRLIVVLTRPRDYRRDPKKDETMARLTWRRWPVMAEAITRRAEVYNRQLDGLEELARQGRALIVAPDDIGGMSTLTRDVEEMETLYRKGLADADTITEFLRV